MDLDNLEFRPITDGLGFDKTTEEVKTKSNPQVVKKESFQLSEETFVEPPAPVNPAPVSRSLKKMLDSLPPSVDFKEDKEREMRVKAPEPMPAQPEAPIYRPTKDQQFDITLDNSLSQAFPKEEVNKRFFHQTVEVIPQFKEIQMSPASAIIDFLIILGLSSLFVVSLVAFTGVDIVALLTHSQLSQRTMLEIGLLYAGVGLFYFMIARGLFGSTLGDWAFDVQLGSEKERFHIMYPFQVLFRTFVIMLTGIILIPLVSLGFGKDMAYYISGLKLYSRQY